MNRLRTTRLIPCLAFLVMLSGTIQASDVSDDERVTSAIHLIEVWVEAQVDWKNIPGASMAIVHDQDVLWSRGFGYAHVESKTPAAPDTIYSICSISKLFTSIGVLQLRDQGKLRLDDPVAKHVSWFDIHQTHEGSAPITIRAILTHASGLPRESDYPYWTGPEYDFPTRDEIIERVSKQETIYPAFTYFQYSNLGLTLAGEVVAAVSGKPYADYVHENILDPLGLRSTSPGIPSEHRRGRLATPYSRPLRDGSRKTIDFYTVNGVAPAAGYASTVEDLARFASWQFRLLENGGHEVLDANTLKEMQRVQFLDPSFETAWGLGFSVSRRDDSIYVGHGGSCPGYRTELSLDRKNQIAIVFMSNGHEVSPRDYTSHAHTIMAKAVKQALDENAAVKPADPSLEKYVGRYERPLGGESHVLVRDGQLVVLPLPTDDPVDSLMKLKYVSDHTFKRIRDDGELGEPIVFELDSEGNVTRMVRHSNYSVRIPD